MLCFNRFFIANSKQIYNNNKYININQNFITFLFNSKLKEAQKHIYKITQTNMMNMYTIYLPVTIVSLFSGTIYFPISSRDAGGDDDDDDV